MKNFVGIIMGLLLGVTMSHFVQAQTFVEQDFGNDRHEGLAYINIKAKQFINEFNQQFHTNWQSLEPNAKVFVPKCAVPLKAKWEKIKLMDKLMDGYIHYKYVIAVYCEKTRDSNQDKWDVWVPVCDEHNKPIISFE